jgi:hypothetical protein
MYLKLDEFIKTSVETYLENVGIRLVGKNRGKHMKLLGIPSLAAMVEYTKKPHTEVCTASAISVEATGLRSTAVPK